MFLRHAFVNTAGPLKLKIIYDSTVFPCYKLKISKAKNHPGKKFCGNGKGVGLRRSQPGAERLLT